MGRWFAFLALAATSTAQAWDHVVAEYPAGPAGDFVPQLITPPDGSGFWAFGYGGSFEPVFVRYDSQNRPVRVRYPRNDFDAATFRIGSNPVTMPDGGFVVAYYMANLFDYFSGNENLQRYDSDGNLRWQVRGQSFNLQNWLSSTGVLQISGGDGTWGGASRIGSDGVATPAVTLPSPNRGTAPDPVSTDFYLLTRDSITKYTIGGEKEWKWQATIGGADLLRLVVGAGGNLYAFGSAAANQQGYGVSLNPDGSLRWEKAYPIGTVEGVGSVATTSAGESYVVMSDQDRTIRLFKVKADGTLGWPNTFTPPGTCDFSVSAIVVAAPNGDALLLHEPSSYCAQTPGLYRFKPDGTQTYAVPVAIDSDEIVENQLRSLADGSTLFARAQHGGFVHVAEDGSALPAPATEHLVASSSYALDRALADDGSTYFLTQRDSVSYVVRHFAVDGSLSWEYSAAGFRSLSTLTTASDRVCVNGRVAPDNSSTSQDLHVVCLSALDGHLLWDLQLTQGGAAGTSVRVEAVRILSGGDVVLVYREGNVMHALSVTAQGVIAHDTPLPVPEADQVLAAVNVAGQIGAAWVDDSGRSSGFASVTPGGSAHTATIPVNPLIYSSLLDLKVNADGSVLLFAGAYAPPSGQVSIFAYRYDTQGMRQWISPALAAGSTVLGPINLDASAVFTSAGGAYVSAQLSSGGLFVSDAKIVTLSLTDGSIAWQTSLALDSRSPYLTDPLSSVLAALTPSPTGADLLVSRAYVGGKIRLTTLDAKTGAIKRDRFEACSTDFCGLAAAGIGNDGALRVLTDTLDGDSGSAAHVHTLDAPFAPIAPIRIGQSGLNGAWYAQYAGGQGFTLDYIASARTIFMPWFTFDYSGTNDPSGLRWYALQSLPFPTLATSADLTIAYSNAGVFNSGSVPGQSVGSAHLSFSDCSHGTLYYQFDHASTGGLITLTRLTPSTDPCLLADNSVDPPQNTSPPANGFDARQSGSWFDPATSGQGVEMTIIPAGNGSAGLVFMPWFTFDPAGSSDDQLSQHWFTLQGDLSTATDGKVELPIYRIIGGIFDLTPTSNFAQVGHTTLTMAGCDSAQLDYQFDSSDVAHAFRGLSGTTHLVKIGGCATGN